MSCYLNVKSLDFSILYSVEIGAVHVSDWNGAALTLFLTDARSAYCKKRRKVNACPHSQWELRFWASHQAAHRSPQGMASLLCVVTVCRCLTNMRHWKLLPVQVYHWMPSPSQLPTENHSHSQNVSESVTAKLNLHINWVSLGPMLEHCKNSDKPYILHCIPQSAGYCWFAIAGSTRYMLNLPSM